MSSHHIVESQLKAPTCPLLPSPSQPSRLLRIHLVLRLQSRPRLHRLKRRLAPVQLAAVPRARGFLARSAAFELVAHADGLVAAEALAHVDHAALALTEAALELLALRGEGVDERRGEAFEGRVAGDEDAVAVLEALR